MTDHPKDLHDPGLGFRTRSPDPTLDRTNEELWYRGLLLGVLHALGLGAWRIVCEDYIIDPEDYVLARGDYPNARGDCILVKRFLPDILASNVWWCQGYSEPGSGSDLASLKTKAVKRNDLDEEYYVVNGAKTWTTLAQNADWIFCLVRTDSSGIKQEGISFLLIDMKSPGIEVKPIITIDGDHEVNTVFFSDVKVPAKNLIGEEGKGWTYAKFLLAHERFGIAAVGSSMRELDRLKKIVNDIDNDDLRKKVGELEVSLSALEITELRLLSELENGGHPGAESSILKIKGTEMQQKISELFVEASGEYALMYPGPHGYGSNDKPAGPDYAANGLSAFLNLRKTSIYGGSNEIQKNILSKFVLGV
mgnify:CR=1 FL=1